MPAKKTVTLTANTVEEVDMGVNVYLLEVYSDGTAAVDFVMLPSTKVADAVNFPPPTVGGDDQWTIPAAQATREAYVKGARPQAGSTIVRLISAGTPTLTLTGLES